MVHMVDLGGPIWVPLRLAILLIRLLGFRVLGFRV